MILPVVHVDPASPTNFNRLSRAGDGLRQYGSLAGYVGTKPPATIASAFDLTWPSALPTQDGQMLTATQLGVMSWTTPASPYTDESAQDAIGGILVDSDSIDLTYNDSTPSITAVVLPAGVDHNSLANLATGDVHTQYPLLAGRSGGQTQIGGTASGEDLTLQSTSHSTGGTVFIQGRATQTQDLFSILNNAGNGQVRVSFGANPWVGGSGHPKLLLGNTSPGSEMGSVQFNTTGGPFLTADASNLVFGFGSNFHFLTTSTLSLCTTTGGTVTIRADDGSNRQINLVLNGSDTTSATAGTITTRGGSRTGTNLLAGNNVVAPGQSTGSQTPASVIIQSTVAGASGTTAQTLWDFATVGAGTLSLSDGGARFHATPYGPGGFSDHAVLGFVSTQTLTKPTSWQFNFAPAYVSIATLTIGNGAVAGSPDYSAALSATPAAGRIMGTSGLGSNIAGATLYIAPGNSTGNATPGSVVIQSAVAGASSSTLQTLVDLVYVTNNSVSIGKSTAVSSKLDVRSDTNSPIRWGTTTTQYGFLSSDTGLAAMGGLTSMGLALYANSAEVMRLLSDAVTIQLGGGATAANLRFMEPSGGGTNYTEFKAQAQAANITYTLPAAAAVGVLTNDASNVLSWTAPFKGLFNNVADVATTSVDGTENDLYSHTLAASTLAVDGDMVVQMEQVNFVTSGTASRRIRKYFAGTQIFDSGTLTLAAGGDFTLRTEIIRESSTVVRVTVTVTTTSASTVPYVTYTRITGLTLSSTNILKATGVAAGAGAASGDITERMGKVFLQAA